MPAIHLLIHGKVQGVFYRATARNQALELGLNGWVRNTEEGQVEALVQGAQDKLDRFLDWCHQGPSRAQVTRVDATPLPDEQALNGFQVRR